jgi:putative membrane protein
MYIGKDFSAASMWHFAQKNLIRTALVSSVAVILYKYVGLTFVAIPFVPIASIGTAVAFYVGFKNNQAYDRLWEARRLWGSYTNISRNLTTQLLSVLEDKDEVKSFMYRHISYLNLVRLQLRRTIEWATSKEDLHQRQHTERDELVQFDEGVRQILEENNKMEYYDRIIKQGNPASYLLKYQMEELKRWKTEKKIDDFEHSDLLKHVNELFNIQGGCERIKSTPLFRQYSIFSRVFVILFINFLPYGLLKEMNALPVSWGVWLTVPFTLVISWVFFTMEQIGEFSENPFDNSINDTPLSTICRNIEIDVKEILGEENLPQKIQPVNNVLL